MKYSLQYQGSPILSETLAPASNGEDLSELITAMWEIMYSNRGQGLAANQVGASCRVIVFHVGKLKQVIINPVITKRSKETNRAVEGCLSFPQSAITKIRSKGITVTGWDENWNPVKLKLNKQAARCVLHEVDHLNGVTLIPLK